MNLRQMQYVLKIAELQSISKAASELYLSQPSLSQFVQKLEKDLGVQLFDRSTQPIQLTYAGKRYIETARKILELNNHFLRELQDITDYKKGSLTLGVPLYSGTYLLPIILPLFRQKYPGVEIVLVEKPSSELEEAVIKNEVDFAILNLPIRSKTIIHKSILSEEILLAVSADHEPLHKTRVNLSDFKEEAFVLLKQGSKLRDTADNFFKQAGFKPNILLESSNVITIHHLVMAGFGATLIPETIAKFFGGLQKAHYYYIEGATPHWTLVIAYKKGRYLSTLDHEFFSIVKQILFKNSMKIIQHS